MATTRASGRLPDDRRLPMRTPDRPSAIVQGDDAVASWRSGVRCDFLGAPAMARLPAEKALDFATIEDRLVIAVIGVEVGAWTIVACDRLTNQDVEAGIGSGNQKDLMALALAIKGGAEGGRHVAGVDVAPEIPTAFKEMVAPVLEDVVVVGQDNVVDAQAADCHCRIAHDHRIGDDLA
jgi:hypothetical protein